MRLKFIPDSLRQFCFNTLLNKNIIYNQCWEDPELDKVILELKPTDTLLVLSSAGCNILDYLLQGVKKIYAVDFNFRQNALLELKLVMIQHLDYETFFAFFGKGRVTKPEKIYRDVIRQHLSKNSQIFWDESIKLFDAKRRVSFYFSTTSGVYARIMNVVIRRILGLNHALNNMINADTLEEQAFLYEDMKPKVFSTAFRFFLKLTSLLTMIGVPLQQIKLIQKGHPGGVYGFVKEAVSYVMTKTHIKKENYFWLAYLTGQYTDNCCPSYLKYANFTQLKTFISQGRIEIHSQSITDFLRANSVRINKFVLLDHMDWLSTPGKLSALQEEWEYIFKRAATDARVIWRSAGATLDWLGKVSIRHNNASQPLFASLRFHQQMTDELHKKDRAHTYGLFCAADLLRVV